jgi:hypothetical protein
MKRMNRSAGICLQILAAKCRQAGFARRWASISSVNRSMEILKNTSVNPLKERIAALRRLPPEEFRFSCLFWSFWLTLVLFPAGYLVRDVMPVVCLVFLIRRHLGGPRAGVWRRLDARPLFYCLWLMMLTGILFSENIFSSLRHVGKNLNMGVILPFIAMESVREEKDLRR